MRKWQTKIHHRSSTENSRKFNYYSGRILDEKLLKSSREWKKINTGKLHVYSSFRTVCHLLNSGEWMENYEQWMESYEQKNHVKNRVKFRYTRREVQVLHTVHFRRICFWNYLKTVRIQRKPSTWKSSAFSLAFQRYIICPIPIKFVKITAKIRL